MGEIQHLQTLNSMKYTENDKLEETKYLEQ